MLNNIANKNKILPLLFQDENKIKNYQELILRFFELKNIEKYNTSMYKIINEYMVLHQNDGELEIKKHKAIFLSTIYTVKTVMGNDVFRDYLENNDKKISKFSGSVYDSIIVSFSYFDKIYLIQKSNLIRDAINAVKIKDYSYKKDIYAAIGSKNRVKGRMKKI